ncbi:vanin-like protein 1 [Nomia melanderi]|uniref:vanin-like protein 1 n=1 Tax=Nomia melanderi TaxID=2448451 RepID=UPI0013043F12|nr:vanin-like protein 1 [Nomia melanderi]XP_031828212.1 vanin-like protein 1 [Nomia melanderi]
MHRFLGSLGVLLALSQLSHQAVVQTPKDHYVAAVVEFSPDFVLENGPATLMKNAKSYIKHIEKAKEQDADIIVFPEDGLTSLMMTHNMSLFHLWTSVIPAPEEEYTPCTQNREGVHEAVKLLSCAARDNGMYVAVNIAEQVPSKNGTYYQNCNVVFDRNGKIVARYRKVNLYMEYEFQPGDPKDIVTFETDFGVKFGMFICFDILFPIPSLNLTRTLGITDILYSTAWFSEAPFLTAVQTQYGWAHSEDVNMLASGYNTPSIGSTGSGIYLGRDGIADAVMSHSDGDKLLVARVPKKTGSRRLKVEDAKRNIPVNVDTCYRTRRVIGRVEGIFLKTDNFTMFESVLLDRPSLDGSICQGGFCCEFHLNRTLEDSPASKYRAVVYNGCRRYGESPMKSAIRLCALTQCASDSLSSCGTVSPSKTVFSDVKIAATFPDYSKAQVMPTTLGSSVLPLEHWSYEEEAATEGARVTVSLNKPTDNLATFGLFATDYRHLESTL